MPNTSIKINPFPGLRPFQESEDHLFFGREQEVAELRKRLLTSRFLAVVGTSGSGKSSLVRSGLLPSLNKTDLWGGDALWRKVVFRPGNDPLRNLSNALARTLFGSHNQDQNESWNQSVAEAIISNRDNGLISVARQAGLQPNEKLVIVVDQFEELFRFSDKHVNNVDIRKDIDGLIKILLEAYLEPSLQFLP